MILHSAWNSRAGTRYTLEELSHIKHFINVWWNKSTHKKEWEEKKYRGVEIRVWGQRRENVVRGRDEVMMTCGKKAPINRISWGRCTRLERLENVTQFLVRILDQYNSSQDNMTGFIKSNRTQLLFGVNENNRHDFNTDFHSFSTENQKTHYHWRIAWMFS